MIIFTCGGIYTRGQHEFKKGTYDSIFDLRWEPRNCWKVCEANTVVVVVMACLLRAHRLAGAIIERNLLTLTF